MDLAHYAVNAVVVEGRSVRAVATATGTSKSWVQRHVQLFRDGGAEALEPRRRGLTSSRPHGARGRRRDRLVAQAPR